MVHEDHTNWQDPATLSQLMERCGYEVFDGVWVQPPRGILKTWKRLCRPYFAHGFMLLGRLRATAGASLNESAGSSVEKDKVAI